jgi:hypothetical protein
VIQQYFCWLFTSLTAFSPRAWLIGIIILAEFWCQIVEVVGVAGKVLGFKGLLVCASGSSSWRRLYLAFLCQVDRVCMEG